MSRTSKAALFHHLLLVGLARAAQPGAPAPIAAPMRELVWGQLNVLHTTDTHGWHGGHLQEAQYGADWGDYVSFAAHLRARADAAGRDLLLVDTGDRVEGNGLYDASRPKGRYDYDVYREQHVDLLCSGNHELYQAPTTDAERRRTVPAFADRYLASNLDYVDAETGERSPMAQRYTRFTTKNQKLDVVAFGFVFDFAGNANNSVVQPVEDTVKEPWFQSVVRQKPDLFIVIGHVGVRMPEFKAIYTAIRQQDRLAPIAFFGGHVHVRDATAYDDKAFAMASGRYFETIGWMSIDGIGNKTEQSGTQPVRFTRRYMDNNLGGLYHHSRLNATTFPTEHGRNVTAMIARARKELDLDHAHGCAPQDYWMTRAPYPGRGSIFSLLEDEVLPAVAVSPGRRHVPRLAIMNTGAIRFDIFKGAFTRDSTYIVSPFLSKLVYIRDVPYAVAQKVLPLINSGGKVLDAPGLDARLLAIPEQWDPCASAVGSQAASGPQDEPEPQPDLIGGYTTKDDIGSDGDDAVHAPLNFYAVPNCIQAEVAFPAGGDPDTVDLVFFDFIQPFVLLALQYAGGGDYNGGHVEPYRPETFTELLEGWIKEHWPPKCPSEDADVGEL